MENALSSKCRRLPNIPYRVKSIEADLDKGGLTSPTLEKDIGEVAINVHALVLLNTSNEVQALLRDRVLLP